MKANNLMTVRLTRFLMPEELKQINDEARAQGFYHHDRRIFKPGWAWYEYWYYDPEWKFRDIKNPMMDRTGPMIKDASDKNADFLSPHYWKDWAHKRPPICVVCPNGEQWDIDRKSSNGEGWTVTGEFPNITCSPSIVVPGYHGFLQNGQFTANLDDKNHPDGIKQYEE